MCASHTDLILQTTVISPDVWSWLRHLRALKSLWPEGWSQSMSAKDFEALRGFTQLESLSIVPEGVEDQTKSATLVMEPSCRVCSPVGASRRCSWALASCCPPHISSRFSAVSRI